MRMTICPVCGGKITEHHEPYRTEYKGKNFSYDDYLFYSCDHCGADFEPDNPGLNAAYTVFQREVDGLLTPAEIKGIRAKFGLTQTQFAERLGVAEKSFARYENGIVSQGRSMDNLLRVLDSIPEAMNVLTGEKTVANPLALPQTDFIESFKYAYTQAHRKIDLWVKASATTAVVLAAYVEEGETPGEHISMKIKKAQPTPMIELDYDLDSTCFNNQVH